MDLGSGIRDQLNFYYLGVGRRPVPGRVGCGACCTGTAAWPARGPRQRKNCGPFPPPFTGMWLGDRARVPINRLM
jgi:hypothetical protein